jgi:hypothetical protein
MLELRWDMTRSSSRAFVAEDDSHKKTGDCRDAFLGAFCPFFLVIALVNSVLSVDGDVRRRAGNHRPGSAYSTRPAAALRPTVPAIASMICRVFCGRSMVTTVLMLSHLQR